MKTIYTYVKVILKFLFFVLSLPFVVVYIAIRYTLFKLNFNKEAKKHGLDKDAAKNLTEALSPFNALKKKKDSINKKRT